MNGNFVTRAELEAHLQPMRSKIDEIGRDVKTLVAAQAGDEAVEEYQDRLAKTRRWLIATVFVAVNVIVGSGSAVATIYLSGGPT